MERERARARGARMARGAREGLRYRAVIPEQIERPSSAQLAPMPPDIARWAIPGLGYQAGSDPVDAWRESVGGLAHVSWSDFDTALRHVLARSGPAFASIGSTLTSIWGGGSRARISPDPTSARLLGRQVSDSPILLGRQGPDSASLGIFRPMWGISNCRLWLKLVRCRCGDWGTSTLV